MAKDSEYTLRPMIGQNPENEAMYRFKDDGKGGMKMHPKDFKVMKEITERDMAVIREIEDKARKKKQITRLDEMAYKEAQERLNRQGIAVGGADQTETGRGWTAQEGAEMTERLKKMYPNSGLK